MKKIALTIVIISCSFLCSYGQDLILTKTSDIIQAKILEVTSNEIKYKKHNNPNGPIFSLEKSKVVSITYENGEKELIDIAPAPEVEKVLLSPFQPCGYEIMAYDLPYKLRYRNAMEACPEGFRLPTYRELECMCDHQKEIGYFEDRGQYWSSERGKTITFNDCESEDEDDDEELLIRCIKF